MSKISKRVCLIAVGFILICVCFMMIYSNLVSRKITKLYSNVSDISDVPLQKPSFDVDDVEETKKLLTLVNDMGSNIESAQNDYRKYYYESRLADKENDTEKRETAIASIKECNHKMKDYISDSKYNDVWELLDVEKNLTWKFEPIYQYGGQKVPMSWICQDETGQICTLVSCSYDVSTGKLSGFKVRLTPIGLALRDSENGGYGDQLVALMKEMAEQQKIIAKEYNEKHRRENDGDYVESDEPSIPKDGNKNWDEINSQKK